MIKVISLQQSIPKTTLNIICYKPEHCSFPARLKE